MSPRRSGSAGKADGVPLRAEGFPCRPLVRVLRPPFLCFPFQPRFGWLEKPVGVLPGPALYFSPGRMRPRKLAMTTRPSPQLLSSLRGASLRDELYFSWIPSAAQLPRLSLCKVSRRRFRHKTWEVLSTTGVMPDSPAKPSRPAPAAAFRAPTSAPQPPTPFPTGLPTKVDLHVHEITPTRRTTTRTRAQNPRPTTFPPKTAGGTPIPIWLSQVFP